jgi:hypothetical protein|tara:strand:- start:926 stop:1141 length:216 start_codon:yes stop_codon:yes gene_type:complete
MTITKETIEERKEVLLKDIQLVKQRLTEYEQKKMEDTALVNALTGALQQCDVFLKEYDEEPELVSDSGDVD